LTMKSNSVKSDQLIKWSEYYESKIYSYFTSKKKDSFAQTPTSGSYCAWFLDRTLQTLWQTWVQMCQWQRPWTQILSVGEQAWYQATNGLCSSRFKAKGRRIFGKLSKNKNYFRRTLRNQSRAFTSKGEVLARSPPKVHKCHDSKLSDRC
jgi:hypothetical protein